MSFEVHVYHQERARQCQSMADCASDPDIRRRHETLASLHAGRAAFYQAGRAESAELSAV